jgi:hypothetical protein
MTLLTPDSLPAFLARFQNFYDGVLRAVEFRYRPGDRRLVVVASAKDADHPEGWSTVRLEVGGVSACLFREGPATCQILSDGLTVLFAPPGVHLSFSSPISDPATAEEIATGDFFAVGRECRWEAGEYAE